MLAVLVLAALPSTAHARAFPDFAGARVGSDTRGKPRLETGNVERLTVDHVQVR